MKAKLFICILLCFTFSCGSTDTPAKIEIYKVATRQLPPEETYSRLRWVRPPQNDPAKHIEAQTNKTQIFQIIHFNVKNMPLREAALVFTAQNKYKSHVKASIANQRLTLSILGTMHEIASAIESKSGISVIIDHKRKTVRFL